MQCLGALPAPVAKCLGQGPKKKAKGNTKNKRAGVSAEAGGGRDDEAAEIKVYQKTAEHRERLRQHTIGKTLFAGMSEDQHEAVIDAMFEVHCNPAQVIIAQGDMVSPAHGDGLFPRRAQQQQHRCLACLQAAPDAMYRAYIVAACGVAACGCRHVALCSPLQPSAALCSSARARLGCLLVACRLLRAALVRSGCLLCLTASFACPFVALLVRV
jgi:hypothetical protein